MTKNNLTPMQTNLLEKGVRNILRDHLESDFLNMDLGTAQLTDKLVQQKRIRYFRIFYTHKQLIKNVHPLDLKTLENIIVSNSEHRYTQLSNWIESAAHENPPEFEMDRERTMALDCYTILFGRAFVNAVRIGHPINTYHGIFLTLIGNPVWADKLYHHPKDLVSVCNYVYAQLVAGTNAQKLSSFGITPMTCNEETIWALASEDNFEKTLETAKEVTERPGLFANAKPQGRIPVERITDPLEPSMDNLPIIYTRRRVDDEVASRPGNKIISLLNFTQYTVLRSALHEILSRAITAENGPFAASYEQVQIDAVRLFIYQIYQIQVAFKKHPDVAESGMYRAIAASAELRDPNADLMKVAAFLMADLKSLLPENAVVHPKDLTQVHLASWFTVIVVALTAYGKRCVETGASYKDGIEQCIESIAIIDWYTWVYDKDINAVNEVLDNSGRSLAQLNTTLLNEKAIAPQVILDCINKEIRLVQEAKPMPDSVKQQKEKWKAEADKLQDELLHVVESVSVPEVRRLVVSPASNDTKVLANLFTATLVADEYIRSAVSGLVESNERVNRIIRVKEYLTNILQQGHATHRSMHLEAVGTKIALWSRVAVRVLGVMAIIPTPAEARTRLFDLVISISWGKVVHKVGDAEKVVGMLTKSIEKLEGLFFMFDGAQVEKDLMGEISVWVELDGSLLTPSAREMVDAVNAAPTVAPALEPKPVPLGGQHSIDLGEILRRMSCAAPNAPTPPAPVDQVNSTFEQDMYEAAMPEKAEVSTEMLGKTKELGKLTEGFVELWFKMAIGEAECDKFIRSLVNIIEDCEQITFKNDSAMEDIVEYLERIPNETGRYDTRMGVYGLAITLFTLVDSKAAPSAIGEALYGLVPHMRVHLNLM